MSDVTDINFSREEAGMGVRTRTCFTLASYTGPSICYYYCYCYYYYYYYYYYPAIIQ